jgi:ATP-binding cassette subfamily B protein AbcA/BmrA
MPQEGYITVGGEDINSYNMKSYREHIAYITQESTMLSGTIKENILYGVNREVDEQELNQVCIAANAYDFIMEFPEGFETQVGEAGGKLSGGQKQRIAIARAMLKRPKFMFLDEATAALDAKAKQEVWFGLENLMGGKTTVMVAHDYQTASHADFVVILDHGKIADKGSQEELYKRNQFFRDFVNGKEGSV